MIVGLESMLSCQTNAIEINACVAMPQRVWSMPGRTPLCMHCDMLTCESSVDLRGSGAGTLYIVCCL